MDRRLGLLPLAFFAFLCSAPDARAQAVGPDEAIGLHGTTIQNFALTPAQRNAIYNQVVRRKVPALKLSIAAFVGAPVLPSMPLGDLPTLTTADGTGFLKYALAEDNVVLVVDPIQMRVVDILDTTTP